MEDSARTQSASESRPRPARARRVPAYFTMYLLNELLSSLRLRPRD
jgi:hypothetical protein